MLAMQKLYCYVDETGQDTEGRFFVVAAVAVGEYRDQLRELLHRIELTSGKGQKKWKRATRKQRRAYMEMVLRTDEFRGTLFFAQFNQTRDYRTCVLEAVAAVLGVAAAHMRYQATIFIDGLGKTERFAVSLSLRRLHVSVEKVRGITDEAEALIRLADTLAGFVRDCKEGDPEFAELFNQAVRQGWLKDVGAK